jgi:hypothetical protein
MPVAPRWVGAVVIALLAVCERPADAQPAAAAAALKAALEGRQVTVLIDMPATSGGVDLYPQREPDIDAATHGLRLKSMGTAIRRGDRVPITLIKVNKKNIEVQLAGGGYGTRGDDVAILVPIVASKTTRERDLERERDRTRDEARRREIDRELRGLADDRQRDAAAANQRAELAHAIKQAEIARKRLEKGSRFNVWYPDKRLEQWVPSPDDFRQALSQYLSFSDPRLASLRRGMKVADVYSLLGFPDSRRPTREGEFTASVENWNTRTDAIEITFVDGLVVKFTSSSK